MSARESDRPRNRNDDPTELEQGTGTKTRHDGTQPDAAPDADVTDSDDST